MEEKKELTYILGKKILIVLFLYYIVLVIVGIVTIIMITSMSFEDMEETLLTKYTFIVSLAAGAMTSGMQYVRRLYKACISNRVVFTNNGNIEKIGNTIYFFTRPLFSCVFSTLIVVGLLGGVFLILGSMDYVFNDKFLYLCLIASSLMGYSVGRVLEQFEKMSIEKVTSVNKEKRNNNEM